MANRSHLYALNGVPAPGVPIDVLKVIGVSEFSYDIPLAYKLLVSSNPRACQSLIWEDAGAVAIIGSYAGGVERLRTFLQRLEHPAAAPLVRETLEFLTLERNKRSHFLLEAGEIFDLSDEPLELQNAALLAKIAQLEPTFSRYQCSPRPKSRQAGLRERSPQSLKRSSNRCSG